MLHTFDRSEPVLNVPDGRTDIMHFANSLDKVKFKDLFFVETIEKWLRGSSPKDWNQVYALLNCMTMKLRSSIALDFFEAETIISGYYRIMVTGITGCFVSLYCVLCLLYSV